MAVVIFSFTYFFLISSTQVIIISRTDLTSKVAQSKYWREQTTDMLESIHQFYTERINSEVRANNWDMGCSDLNVLAPYVRIVMDHFSHGKRQLIFDVGANNGQDASMVLGVFQQIIGMCHSYGHSFKIVSVEPSPIVFCELEELAHKRGWARSEILRLNAGLSDQSGVLEFSDPGHEGGSLIGSLLMDLPELSMEILNRMVSCSIDDFKNYTIGDYNRRANVTVFTLDQLVKSLELSTISEMNTQDNILILKIDTEGHDFCVIKGANSLLAKKRITFVLFEVWSNPNMKAIVEFLDQQDYLCFLIFPRMLIPVHAVDWWYPHLDNFTSGWWGNGFCGIRNSPTLSLLYKAFHADDDFLLGAHDFVMERSNTSVL